MSYRSYHLPSATERDMRRQLKDSDARCARLISECSGAAEIAVLDARVASLEAEVTAKDMVINSLKARCANLTDKNKVLKEANGTRHQECNAHILRYLKGVSENEPTKKWAEAMTTLLCECNNACKTARAKSQWFSQEEIAGFEERYDAICAQAEAEYAQDLPVPAKYTPDGLPLSKRMREFRDAHLLFLHDPEVPFENNASERYLRGVKKKIKQTGGFKSLECGQSYYCDFLSIVQSAAVRGMEVFGVVQAVYDGKQGILAAHDAKSQKSDP